jgi:hypothetical protein
VRPRVWMAILRTLNKRGRSDGKLVEGTQGRRDLAPSPRSIIPMAYFAWLEALGCCVSSSKLRKTGSTLILSNTDQGQLRPGVPICPYATGPGPSVLSQDLVAAGPLATPLGKITLVCASVWARVLLRLLLEPHLRDRITAKSSAKGRLNLDEIFQR